MIFTIKPNSIINFFGSVKELTVSNEGVTIIRKSSKKINLHYSDFYKFPEIHKGLFWNKILVPYEKKFYKISFLNKSKSREIFEILEKQSILSLTELVDMVVIFFKREAIDKYLRDSSIDNLDKAIEDILLKYNSNKIVWKNKINENTITSLNEVINYYPVDNKKDTLRSLYETKTLISRKLFFNKIESNPLTDQQRLAVIRNNDLNLVLAAAGTGKTSVIVSKAIDLIDSKRAKANEILILAYNNKAAKELRARLLQRGEVLGITEENSPNIYTFHALGRLILKEAKISTYLSDFTDDPKKLEIWLTKWIMDYMKSSHSALKLIIDLSYQPINPFDFKSKEEYDSYIRDNEYRTFQGERVKSYQEILIANWLYMNGVDYEYEAPFVSKRRIEVGFDYRPDFHIKNTNIYLEHFGIDRDGKTRFDIDKEKYNNDILRKRDLHKECQTTLIETYHYDWIENNLEQRLEILISENGIKTHKRSDEEMFDVLKEMGFIEENSKKYLKCLQAIRVERLDKESILKRLKSSNIFFAKQYTELLDAIQNSYINELVSQNKIDFDDMIIRSTKVVEDGEYRPKWNHILVDEFQDISMSRMDFLKSIINHGSNPILTAVGDDWQSIYRFSGGKLELTTRFDTLIGQHSFTKLEKTFRYNNSIADTAGMFVMQNPEQYKKNVETHTKVTESQVYLIDSKYKEENSIENRTLQVIKKIRENDANGSIAILARYNYLLKNSKEAIKNDSQIENIYHWTFHGSKGLEAEYCILLGFFQGKVGFPNMNKEEAVVVEALLPSLDTYPHSEERRLLYVALTRAKKKSYLIADPMATSEFINELLSPKYKLNIVSATFEEKFRKIFKCPLCTSGYFRLVKGKYGEFYSCTSGSVCLSKPRICEKCEAPSIDTANKSICNNINCKHEKIICDRCGRPMTMRDGKFGKFLGCTGYGIKGDQCKNTRKYL